MIEIDDRKKKSRKQKDREIRNIMRQQWIYTCGLVVIAKVVEVKELVVIDAIFYLIFSVINLIKIDEIKKRNKKR